MLIHVITKQKKVFFIFFLFLTMLLISACEKKEQAPEGSTQTGQTAVADFQQMKLPIPLNGLEYYTTDGKWFYITRQVFDPGSTYQILRGAINSNYEGEVYLSRENAVCLALAADRESHCFVLWKEGDRVSLEKYDESGKLLWHTNQDDPQLTAIDRIDLNGNLYIAQSIVTTGGRLALYTYGRDRLVILFDENGTLLQITALEPDCSDGIVAGRENHVYGYCITGEEEPVLADIDNPSQYYILPFKPLNVFSGQEDGVYLSTSEGLWSYDPETGHTAIKWRWADEYMNVDYQQLREVFCGNGEWYLLCYTFDSLMTLGEMTTKVTLVSVREENRREYGEKEILTLGYMDNGVSDQRLERLVHLYNRQSKKYRVELVPYREKQEDVTGGVNALTLELLQGEGPDLIEVRSVYAGSLADKGAFCDLSDYYAKSPELHTDSILDVVWEGMQCRGKNVLVIPSFCLIAQACWEPIATEEWTPEKLIRLADDQESLWQFGTPAMWLLRDCLRPYGEYERYIDYEKKQSHFDCSEFRWILENCARAGKEASFPEIIFTNSAEQPAFLYDYYIYNMNDFFWHCQNLDKLSCCWVGNPSWDGAVYRLVPDNIFAMNQATENKEGAWDFLRYILSAKCQNQIDWSFPVREDSFERYLSASYRSKEEDDKTISEFQYSTNSFDPTQEDFDHLRYMVSHSFIEQLSGSVHNIVTEEAGMYFAGDATLDETVHKIDSRVTLFLNE